MKNRIFLLVMIISANLLNGQSYILDSAYGTQGYKFNDNYLLAPKGLLKLNQSYFYFSSNEISKTNYNGNLDSSFGVNSKLSFGNSNETYTINGGKIINNSIFLFGKIVNTNDNSEDGFVLKISENGIYDAAFGVNGISKVNFGENEDIFDFCIDNSGKLFCAGIKQNSSTSKVVTFKLLANGTIDTSFGTNSFKEYVFEPLAKQYLEKIIKVNDGYLLIGNIMFNQTPSLNPKLVIAKVDENGDFITTFATNGIKLFQLEEGFSYGIKDAKLVNTKLYVSTFEIGFNSFNNHATKLRKIDITNFQEDFNIFLYYSSDFKLDANENIYVAGNNRCNYQPCYRELMLKKFDSSGNVDTSFAQNGIFSMYFPGLSNRDYQSPVVNLEEDGKIVIGGYVFRNYFDENNNYVSPRYGLSSIRIVQGTLNNESFNLNEKATIFPNPVTENLKVICNEEIKEIKIFDMQNKLILNTNKVDNNSIDVTKLDAGIYLVVISTDNTTYYKKCIKN